MSGLLYQLEEERDRTIVQYMQDRLQVRPGRIRAHVFRVRPCDEQTPELSALDNHQGTEKLRLSVPKFRCCESSDG